MTDTDRDVERTYEMENAERQFEQQSEAALVGQTQVWFDDEADNRWYDGEDE